MLTFVTSNKNKADIARLFLAPFQITFTVNQLDLEEIQSDDFLLIAEKKAKQAFSLLNRPLFITDHSWTITALNGFPGPYMKYMNEWLTANDFLKLMEGNENREVFLHDILCYIDDGKIKVFANKSRGTVLFEKQGIGLPGQQVISLTDDHVSIAKKIRIFTKCKNTSPCVRRIC